MTARAGSALFLALTLAACGGSAASPTAPTPAPAPSPAPGGQRTLTRLVVSGDQTVVAGATDQFMATAQWSDGSSENVTDRASWRTGNASIAIVNEKGLVTGMSGGSTVISAAFQNQTGELAITVAGPAQGQDNIQQVTVTATRIDINGSCDRDSIFESGGDGEFQFVFELERPGQGRTPIWRTGPRAFAEGSHVINNESIRFSRNVTRGENFQLWFTGTEYDGALGPDSKFNARDRVKGYTYSSGWGGDRSIELFADAQCGATIYFEITSTR